MNKLTTIAVAVFTASVLFGCGQSVPTVAHIGDETLTLKEFEEAYAKNNGGWEAGKNASIDERKRFLDLLIKFRLKVKEAKERGLLQDTSIQNELEGYRLSVAQTYILEKELIQPNVKRMYERKKDEIRASHILIRVAENATPADTLAAWNRALDVIRQAATVSFDSLAARYSEDPSAATNKGDLGFFSVGRMVPAFEDAGYAMNVGDISATPVRSQFGYHVIKLTGRHPNKGAARVSFILRYYPLPDDTSATRDTMWTVYRRLMEGMDFAEAAKSYSQEPNSAGRGGDVGYFERERIPGDIANVIFAMGEGTVSEPYYIPNGVYIFKVTDFQGIPPFAEAEKNLKQTYQQMRYQKDYAEYIRGLKHLYGFSIEEATRSDVIDAYLDSSRTVFDTLWSVKSDHVLASRPLFRYAGMTLDVSRAFDRILHMAEFQTLKLTKENINRMLDKLSETLVLEEHARRAPERHVTLARLMDEYRDGILLYRIEQDEVWSQVTVNDSLLREFHASRAETYRWPERVNFAEIYVTTDSLRKLAQARLDGGEEFQDVAEEMTARSGYREKRGEWGLQTYAFSDLAKRASTMEVGSVSESFRNGVGWSIIKVLAKDSARTKTFEEARPEATSAYQEYASKEREKEWVASLSAKFGLSVDAALLEKAFISEPSEIR